MMITHLYRCISYWLIELLITVMVGIRSLVGPAQCRYEVSCTNFAIDQLRTQPLHKALINSCKRLASCNPFARTSTRT